VKRKVDELLRIACGYAISSIESEAAGYLHSAEICEDAEAKKKSDDLFDLMEQIRQLYEQRWGNKRK
jgi:hypothetical protein